MHDMESIKALKQGGTLPPQKLMELRSAGMQAVRLEFITRLLRLNIQITTLSIYWEDGREFVQSRQCRTPSASWSAQPTRGLPASSTI